MTKFGPGTIYNLAVAKCVNMATGVVVLKPPAADWSQLPIQSFDLVHEFLFSIAETGRHFYTVPDADLFIMDPVDVIAIKEDGGKFELLDVYDNYKEFYWSIGGDWSNRDTLRYTIYGSGVSTLSARHAVEAYFAMPVGATFRHTYGSVMADYKNITITASNEITQPPLSYVHEVELMIVISGVIIDASFVGATNDSIELNIPPHPGTKVMYTWNFGTGDVMNSTDRVANYTWTEAGVYTITLTAENKVSNVLVTFVILIQDVIINLTAKAEKIATVVTEDTTVFWNISQVYQRCR